MFLSLRALRLRGEKSDAKVCRLQEYYNNTRMKKTIPRRLVLWIRCNILRMHDVDLRRDGPWMQVYCLDCERVLTSYLPGG